MDPISSQTSQMSKISSSKPSINQHNSTQKHVHSSIFKVLQVTKLTTLQKQTKTVRSAVLELLLDATFSGRSGKTCHSAVRYPVRDAPGCYRETLYVKDFGRTLSNTGCCSPSFARGERSFCRQRQLPAPAPQAPRAGNVPRRSSPTPPLPDAAPPRQTPLRPSGAAAPSRAGATRHLRRSSADPCRRPPRAIPRLLHGCTAYGGERDEKELVNGGGER
jgi:hypothetical protein